MSAKSENSQLNWDDFRPKLMALQQRVREAKVPVVLVLEGWDAAGKGTLLGKLMTALDPRGFQVHTIGGPSHEERALPPMARYWVKMPQQGHISIFNGSWYREVTDCAIKHKLSHADLEQRYEDIALMESELVCDGAVILKFFLQIGRKEQRRRQQAMLEKKRTRFLVSDGDLDQNKRYEDYLQLYGAMMERTQLPGALWHVINAEDKSECAAEVGRIVAEAFEVALKDREENLRTWDTPTLPVSEPISTLPIGELSSFSADQPPVEDYKARLDKAQKKLSKLQLELYRRGVPMVLCFEGWDAAGKGGAIRRLASALDPRSYVVVPISSPTPEEKAHHHLWRFWTHLPPDGHVRIFDRTWYGRAMVERIEGFCTENQWKRAYEEMNRFEHDLHRHGAIVLKFWLQITQEEQLTRFTERQNTPEKQWKITDEDWRNREKWSQYEQAVNEMLQKTNTAYAPWVVVEANRKEYARLKVLDTLIKAIEARLDKE